MGVFRQRASKGGHTLYIVLASRQARERTSLKTRWHHRSTRRLFCTVRGWRCLPESGGRYAPSATASDLLRPHMGQLRQSPPHRYAAAYVMRLSRSRGSRTALIARADADYLVYWFVDDVLFAVCSPGPHAIGSHSSPDASACAWWTAKATAIKEPSRSSGRRNSLGQPSLRRSRRQSGRNTYRTSSK